MHLGGETSPVALGRSGESTKDHVRTTATRVDDGTTDRPHPAPNEIPLDGIAHRLRDDEPESGGVGRIALDPIDERAGRRGASSPTHDRTEVRGLDHSVRP